MIAALAYGSRFAYSTPIVVHMEAPMRVPAGIDLPEECFPIQKSKLMNTTDRPLQPPQQEQQYRDMTMKVPNPAKHRRVIFPVLHHSQSIIEKQETRATGSNEISTCVKKVPSLNSLSDLEADYDKIPLSPPFKKLFATPRMNSPICVSSVSPDYTSNGALAPLGSPSYTKHQLSSHTRCPPAIVVPIISPQHGSLSHAPTSILRNKSNESVPSMVSASTSEGSCVVRHVRFDARVCVFEFVRHPREHKLTWFSPSEMEKFRRSALELVCSQTMELVPTGTGRLVRTRNVSRQALFTNARLTADENEDEIALQDLTRHELKNILIIDPHDLCARLFAKAIQHMLPYANVVTAKSSEEAINRIHQLDAATNFDLILVEERLKLIPDSSNHEGSGSALIRLLRAEFTRMVPGNRQPLMIGVSAHFGADKEKLKNSGASLCWPKPPPALDKVMRDNLLKHVLILRGKEETALRYFL
ncbi:hypothetical protein MHU86_25124 [Fragilaria crotonensis]|nr:hypothetical protein MHU86_25124 [Fragilaria crotonensis]